MSEPSTTANILTSEPEQSPAAAGHPKANTSTTAVHPISMPTEPLPEDIDQYVAPDDDNDGDSGYAPSISSGGTSVTSSIYRGYLENGRKYQTLKEEGYITPADEKQFEVLKAGHVMFRILDSQEDNPLFQSPISERAQNVLDIGTGDGSWAIDAADNFPNISVRGVDVFPPAQTLVPPNLVLEVDDITRPWMFNEHFDFIHMRLLVGAFTELEWAALYTEAYNNLVPGGWIEHVENSGDLYCDDGTLSPDSGLAGSGKIFHQCAAANGRPSDTIDEMRSRIEAAGFINVHEKNYKLPVGAWPKHQVYKDAGRINGELWRGGMEGWMLYLLTRFGQPTPWSPEECQIWFAKLRKELDAKPHIYQKTKRVWAQKPYDTAPKA